MPPTFKDLKRYCDKDGWELIRDTDHYFYRKVLSDGNVLRTKVSHGLHKEIPKNLWHSILKNQLNLESEKAFWDKVKR